MGQEGLAHIVSHGSLLTNTTKGLTGNNTRMLATRMAEDLGKARGKET